ncbi:MAG: hypothetical protein ACKPEN_00340 [Planktothrix sp.]|uniref:hypothetical protein n=1 Tax=Planktothrix sp. TaxID=3088171 RepID=UPI0038D43155
MTSENTIPESITNNTDTYQKISPDFEQQLSDPQQSIVTDYSANSDIMLIAFGGMNSRMGMPPFEFFRLAQDYPIKKIFLRDLRQSWYQKGLPQIGGNANAILKYLKAEINQLKPQKIVITGSSAGGFAALLFGYLLEVDIVLSFAPQTFIDTHTCFIVGDNRYRPPIIKLYQYPHGIRKYYNLSKFFQVKHNLKTKFHIYFDENYLLDKRHAHSLKNHRNVILHPYQEGGHGLIRLLKERGELQQILLDALSV